MKVKRFFLGHFINPCEVFHLARVKIYSRQDLSLHNHDFAEMFWVESGNGTHLINGEKVLLKPGNLVMMRPDDRHSFTSGPEGLTIMNLAFSMTTLDHLRDRYFNDSTTYFWTDQVLPFQTRIDMPLIGRISEQSEKIWRSLNTNLYLDSLLLYIFRLMEEQSAGSKWISPLTQAASAPRPAGPAPKEGPPPVWLSQAMQQYLARQQFGDGSRGFAAICDRNIDHVNRMVRKCFHKTLTELVAELRMNFAAKQLSITNVPIKIISSDAGFNNLGHFYKVFREVYHQTPAEYRKLSQQIV